MKNEQKDILDTFTESFPLLEKIYSVYDDSKSISKNEENTLRRSVEVTTLEVLELIVVASRQNCESKRLTLKQAQNKLDTLKVYIDLAAQTGVMDENNYVDLESSINKVINMINGWVNKLNEKND